MQHCDVHMGSMQEAGEQEQAPEVSEAAVSRRYLGVGDSVAGSGAASTPSWLSVLALASSTAAALCGHSIRKGPPGGNCEVSA